MIGTPTRKDKKLQLNEHVEVIWLDSAFELGWRYTAPKGKMNPVKTSGYITYLGPNVVEISSTVGNTGCLNALSIPAGAILSVKRL
jgi:hypothetical protein